MASQLGISSVALEKCDLALFLVSANDGIVSADLEKWRYARELYIPSLVIICDLTVSEIDFEDMSAIASKMLDPVVTPFLVLHSDEGVPAALINLETLQVIDYSDASPTYRPADPEHIELVAEFREEYVEAIEDAGEDSFQAGLLFPAIPWIEGTRMGLDQILETRFQLSAKSLRVSCKSWGNTLVCPITDIKFASPLHRGTTC
ncbi:MAG: hypothetical protein WDN07_05140 [Actinomycetota bacterium]